jgi:hypothetical protein
MGIEFVHSEGVRPDHIFKNPELQKAALIIARDGLQRAIHIMEARWPARIRVHRGQPWTISAPVRVHIVEPV